MTTVRTDVHAPSSVEFDPQKYVFHGVFDLVPTQNMAAEDARRKRVVAELTANGYRFGGSTAGGCGHCGSNLRYAALLARVDVREMIWVGETCLGGRFQMSAAAFQTARKAAALGRQRAAHDREHADRQAEFAAEHPAVVALLTDVKRLDELCDDFLDSVAASLHRYGSLTPAQTDAVEMKLRRLAERERRAAEQAQQPRAEVPVTDERITITGEVIKAEWRNNEWGGSVKITVKSDAGWLVWGTAPKAIAVDVEPGDTVTFTAALERSERDATFGFFRRPVRAAIVSKNES